MRGGRERGLVEDTLDGRVRALAGRAAGAVSDRHEARGERRQPRDRFPQRLVHLLGLRREELEGDVDAASTRLDETACANRVHYTASSALVSAIAMRRSRPSQSETAILACGPEPGASVRWVTTSRPEALIHCATVSGAKPSLRCACWSRRNSSSCGAKSMTSSRP